MNHGKPIYPPLHEGPRPTHIIPKIILWIPFFFLRSRDKTDTVDRLSDSRHVADLRLIVAAALVIVLIALTLACYCAIEMFHLDWNLLTKDPNQQHLKRMLDAGSIFLKISVPPLTVFGALLTWAYQRGSNRLGIVDLFACEIDTICRVIVVIDMAKTLQSESLDSAFPRHFRSQEQYFPILDANSSSLQSLEAKVVVNITAFYTYMKTVRDKFRAAEDAQDDEARGALQKSLIYALFLALESGRKAMNDLVEFEPTHIERTMVILISELSLYRYLRKGYENISGVFRFRLLNRSCGYDQLRIQLEEVMSQHIDAVEAAVKAGQKSQPPSYVNAQWAEACTLWPTVSEEFKILFDIFPLSVSLKQLRSSAKPPE